jgi:site-specific DNA recombinase
MASDRYRPLVPKNGHTLKVLLPCRVSDPEPGKQDERSNDDQEAMLRARLKDYHGGEASITVIAGSGSGEFLERAEYLRLIQLVETGEYDLVLTEDLGRIIRRIHAHLFCETCVEFDTRLIALNDQVDTSEEGWQDRSIFSAWHHERSNRDTSDRIKRTHRSRFDQGGCAAFPIYGYIKPPGAKSDLDWSKDPNADAVYKRMFAMLDEGALYATIGDWLNAEGIETGPFCDAAKWDGPMVARVCHNPLLKGYRQRNRRKSKRNAKGKYISVKAERHELRLRHVPHLAFVEEGYYDRVIAKADARNAKYRRSELSGDDPCRGRPRKRTRYPGQTLRCVRCGFDFVWGGHGQTDRLECGGTRQHRCWHSVSVDGPLAAERIAGAVFAEIERLADFDTVFLEMVRAESVTGDASRAAKLKDMRQKLAVSESEMANLAAFIRRGDQSDWLRNDLARLESDRRKHLASIDELQRLAGDAIVIPSIQEIKAIARTCLRELPRDSIEFSAVLRNLTKPVWIAPYRALDGGGIVLRAHFSLQLAQLLPDVRLRNVLKSHLRRELTVNLFEPVQRVSKREEEMVLRNDHSERETARRLGLTIKVAQQAAVLVRKMQTAGVNDPYVRIYEPPANLAKLRCHKNPRYRFQPREGHEPG